MTASSIPVSSAASASASSVASLLRPYGLSGRGSAPAPDRGAGGADDGELDPGVERGLGQRLFGGELAAAIRAFGARLVLGSERASGRGRRAHRGDRAE